jgi:hypothetical protein
MDTRVTVVDFVAAKAANRRIVAVMTIPLPGLRPRPMST